MVFEAMNNDSSVVDIYKPIGKYKIEGRNAYQINPDGTLSSVSFDYVMQLISLYGASGRKHYKHKSYINENVMYYLLAAASPIIGILLAATVYFYWPFS